MARGINDSSETNSTASANIKTESVVVKDDYIKINNVDEDDEPYKGRSFTAKSLNDALLNEINKNKGVGTTY